MSENPNPRTMFSALLPALAENRPDVLDQIPARSSNEECLEIIADIFDLDEPTTWADLSNIIKKIRIASSKK